MYYGVPSADVITAKIAKMRPTLFTKLDVRMAVSVFSFSFLAFSAFSAFSAVRHLVKTKDADKGIEPDHDVYLPYSIQVSNYGDGRVSKVRSFRLRAGFLDAKGSFLATSAGTSVILNNPKDKSSCT